jgi:hypothetical protein
MELWAIGAILMLAIGVALIGIGWHGRRIDRHPLCAACGYDLIGRLPFTRRCAECGADISGLAIRVGHRVFRPRPFYGGLALSLPALLVIASMTYVVMRGIDITPHKPAWWLVYELGGSEATEAAAFTELATRMQKQLLADHHITSVADHCLENQRSPYAEWRQAWGAFLEASHAAGKLSKDQWSQYAEQGFTLNAYATSAVRGGAVRLNLSVVQSRQTPGAPFVASVKMQDVRIDEEPLDVTGIDLRSVGSRTVNLGGRRQRTEQHVAQIDSESTRTLALGRHELIATVVLLIHEGDEFGDIVATRKLEVTSPFEIKAPSIPSPQITAAMPPAR